MNTTKQQIDNFLNTTKIAIAGVSRDEKKFGNQVFKELRKKGFDILPINPMTDKIEGIKAYKSVNDLPDDINSLLIITPKKQTENVLKNAINKGIINIWVQNSSETKETIKIAEEYDKEVIFKKCIFMFAEPVKGFHKFHRSMVKLFAGLPK